MSNSRNLKTGLNDNEDGNSESLTFLNENKNIDIDGNQTKIENANVNQ